MRSVRGKVFEVILDIRRGSPRFEQPLSVVPAGAGGEQLIEPEVTALSSSSLEDDCEIACKFSSPYPLEFVAGLIFGRPSPSNLRHGVASRRSLSDRYRARPCLASISSPFRIGCRDYCA